MRIARASGLPQPGRRLRHRGRGARLGPRRAQRPLGRDPTTRTGLLEAVGRRDRSPRAHGLRAGRRRVPGRADPTVEIFSGVVEGAVADERRGAGRIRIRPDLPAAERASRPPSCPRPRRTPSAIAGGPSPRPSRGCCELLAEAPSPSVPRRAPDHGPVVADPPGGVGLGPRRRSAADGRRPVRTAPHRSPRIVSRASPTVLAMLVLLAASAHAGRRRRARARGDSCRRARSCPARSSSGGATSAAATACASARAVRPRRARRARAMTRPRSSRPAAGRSPTSSPSCAPIPPSRYVEPNYVVAARGRGRHDGRRRQRPEDRPASTRSTGCACATRGLARPARPSVDRRPRHRRRRRTIRTSPGASLPGHDFVNNDSNAGDDNGHGTWVAGIIAANANDGVRHRRHQLDRQDPAGEDHGRRAAPATRPT